MTDAIRPSHVVIDLGALRHNMRLLKARLGPGVTLYAVLKGDAYGCGIAAVGRVCAAAGADAFAVGDPDEAVGLRAAGVAQPILVYGSTDPSLAAAVARLGAIVTIFDREGLEAYAALGTPLDVALELDCGFGRLGFTPDTIEPVAERLAALPRLRLRNVYTHLAAVDDAAAVERQMGLFAAMRARLRAYGQAAAQAMVASSRVVAAYPQHDLDAVNPGRALYGLLEGRYARDLPVRPVVAAIESRVIQVKTLAPGMRQGYGGADPRPGRPVRAAVIPIGFAGGFPRTFHHGHVLVRGRRAPIIGLMSMEHTLLDVTDIPGAAVGDAAVLLGRQGDAAITQADLARTTGLEALEIVPRLARGLHRVYRDAE